MLKFLFKLLKFPADVKQAITCSTDDTCRLNENSGKKRVVCHLLMYIYMKYYIMNQFLFPLLECFSFFSTYTKKKKKINFAVSFIYTNLWVQKIKGFAYY